MTEIYHRRDLTYARSWLWKGPEIKVSLARFLVILFVTEEMKYSHHLGIVNEVGALCLGMGAH